ncbi:MAG: 16S rRNA (cytidine(1402)-2'-O)-methyltransferase [Solirubrobacteraceae bacterium]|nr:16S rRNA (cytidine(1402)-2'-O)-methyltransferase [Solirubrobacteraceae bacterium]MDP4673188.1 16S rRNA (cytidine(1402)-2'-O)-methyltransferase [Solirubrobacteraceae bacterium]MDP4921521.1 16S rRNA (cytidine(1402)-2'-O)-methyltransferase [Solirubrobacteraceae bacterium]
MSAAANGRLIVCPTPIGNLEDITLRAIEALRGADVIACEDTRTTKVLLDRYEITTPRVRYDEHAEKRATPALIGRIAGGETVALVSDAGTPLVSDPGFVLLQAALAAGLTVEVLPGPSSVLTALVASGLPAEHWRFVGFLPRKRGEMLELLENSETVVAFESPRRAGATLALLAELDAERPVALCREMTKRFEEIVRGSAAELAERYAATAPKGEVVLVIGAAQAGSGDRASAEQAVRELVAAGAKPRPAATVIAGLTGLSANELYRAVAASGD